VAASSLGGTLCILSPGSGDTASALFTASALLAGVPLPFLFRTVFANAPSRNLGPSLGSGLAAAGADVDRGQGRAAGIEPGGERHGARPHRGRHPRCHGPRGLEVDSFGNLANWMIPGKMVPGMGGAMDLVTGARAVYVATTHCDKKGRPKLVKECTLPLTGAKVVSVVVTEFCVVRKVNGKMVLCEISPEITEEELRANTTMDYDISPDLCPMKGIE